jgi:hypothetical protein
VKPKLPEYLIEAGVIKREHGLPKIAGGTRQFAARARDRIQAAKLIEKMLGFINNEEEMTRDQLSAAITLLDRVLPKLTSQTIEVTKRKRDVRELSRQDLLREWEVIREKALSTPVLN